MAGDKHLLSMLGEAPTIPGRARDSPSMLCKLLSPHSESIVESTIVVQSVYRIIIVRIAIGKIAAAAATHSLILKLASNLIRDCDNTSRVV
jgi:hypothetical protein